MSELPTISEDLPKSSRYKALAAQAFMIADGETNFVATAGNIMALLKENFHYLWVGLYVVNQDELHLFVFQGPVACTRIGFGKGVCGTSWQNKATIVVPNVDEFPGHIACSSASKSEIVVPIIKNNEVIAILDVDSEHLDYFDEDDVDGLEEIANILANEVF
jgi:L-methionine (R)-S-oxide reductase